MRPDAREITTATQIYVLDIVIDDIEPPIRRRVELAGDTDLEDLHFVVQAAMGWQNAHLHEFEVDGVSYGEPDPDGPWFENEEGVGLASLLGVGGSLFYLYDYGDGWEHTVTVHEVTRPESGVVYPRLLEAERACPPEDCGGPAGYPDLLSEAARSSGEDEFLTRLRDEFDPEDPKREDRDKALAAVAWTPLAG